MSEDLIDYLDKLSGGIEIFSDKERLLFYLISSTSDVADRTVVFTTWKDMWDRLKIHRKVGWEILKKLHSQKIIEVDFKKRSVRLSWE